MWLMTENRDRLPVLHKSDRRRRDGRKVWNARWKYAQSHCVLEEFAR
jgi:hypothetical protein